MNDFCGADALTSMIINGPDKILAKSIEPFEINTGFSSFSPVESTKKLIENTYDQLKDLGKSAYEETIDFIQHPLQTISSDNLNDYYASSLGDKALVAGMQSSYLNPIVNVGSQYQNEVSDIVNNVSSAMSPNIYRDLTAKHYNKKDYNTIIFILAVILVFILWKLMH
jgi:hypothetical protein